MANKNTERYVQCAVFFFKILGFEFEYKKPWLKVVYIAAIFNMCLVLLFQLMFVPFSDVELEAKTAGISFMNYYLVSIGKMIAWLYNEKAIREAFKEFQQIYPSESLEKAHSLETYLRQYLLIERVLVGFFVGVSVLFNFDTLVVSFVQLLMNGTFGYGLTLQMWYPFETQGNWLAYAFAFIQQTTGNYSSAITILASDLYLFSSVLQLCMQFDLINKNILNIEPDASDKAEKKLKILIAYHQRLLRLAEKVNTIFTPTVLFSLFSSSFIICFTGYQLLGDITLVIILRAFLVLSYEMKQVAITCFLSDKLTETSLKTSDAIYEHKWYDGTPKYRRMVLIILARSQKGVALDIAGITNVSRQTLREVRPWCGVMSASYQIFTVLKTT